jgi:hypothetical protein
VNEKLATLAAAIYRVVDGADHVQHRARVTQAIYEWLLFGDGGVGRTVTDLAAEWREYWAVTADAVDNRAD